MIENANVAIGVPLSLDASVPSNLDVQIGYSGLLIDNFASEIKQCFEESITEILQAGDHPEDIRIQIKRFSMDKWISLIRKKTTLPSKYMATQLN